MLQVLVLFMLYGSVYTAAKFGVNHAEPFFLFGSRTIVAGFLLLLYAFWKIPNAWKQLVKSRWAIIFLTFFNIYLTNGLEMWGLQYISSAKSSFCYSLMPFISAILSYLIFRESLSYKKCLGLLVGFVGFIPILMDSAGEEASLSHFLFISSAEFSAIGAAASSVVGWMFMRQLVEKQFSPILANGASMFLGGLFALIHSGAVESWNPVPIRDGFMLTYLLPTLWMLVVSNFVCYNLFGNLLKTYSVTFMSLAGFSTPFFAALFSRVLLGEHLHPSFFLSAFLVFLGLAIFYYEELRQEGIYQPKTVRA